MSLWKAIKGGQDQALDVSWERAVEEKRSLHVFLWESCISIVSIDSQLLLLHQSQTVSHRDSCQQASRPSSATGPGPD